jgi:flagellar basal body-associated protein FliL
MSQRNIIIVVIVLIVLAIATWWFINRGKVTSNTQESVPVQNESNVPVDNNAPVNTGAEQQSGN